MTRLDIWEGFVRLFPTYVERVETFSKIGSKTIKLKIKQLEGQPEKFLIFMYNDPNDWTFGTRVWRKKPRKYRVDFSAAMKEVKNGTDEKAE